MQENIVGHVKELFLYPVKSMRGISVPQVTCYWYGVNGDRKVAFTRAGILSGFPWLTGRELPALLKYEPYFVDSQSPNSSPIRVRTPDNRDLPLEGSELAQELSAAYGDAISLLKLKRGTFDCMPLSLITSATLSKLEQAAGRALDVRRFRPNVLVEEIDGVSEEAWAGSVLTFGDRDDAARIQANYPTERCVMINLDPHSAESDPRVLKAVTRKNNALAGIYAAVSRPGTIRVGDAVYLEKQE